MVMLRSKWSRMRGCKRLDEEADPMTTPTEPTNSTYSLKSVLDSRAAIFAWSAAGVLGPLVDDPPVVDAAGEGSEDHDDLVLGPEPAVRANCRRATSLNDIWHSSGTLQPSSCAKSEVSCQICPRREDEFKLESHGSKRIVGGEGGDGGGDGGGEGGGYGGR